MKFTWTASTMLTGILLGSGSLAHAHLPEAPRVNEAIEGWYTYRSSAYDFAVALPTNWLAEEPHPDWGIGQVVTLRAPRSAAKVEIGIYSAELITGLSFAAWQALYDDVTAIIPPDEVDERWHAVAQADGRPRRYRSIHSAAADTMQLMQLPHGKTVWFIAGYIHPDDAWAFEEMAASFEFGIASPRTVAEAYGADFHGLDLYEAQRLQRELDAAAKDAGPTPQNNYRIPFEALNGATSGIVRGPNCGSTHQGVSSQAIDYMLSTGKAVLASYSGWIATLAYNGQGFGTYMTIDHQNGYSTLYAHLNGYAGSPWSGMGVSTGCLIAYSGCSGNCSGPHLHFEKRLNGQSQDIKSLPTTVWYTPGVTCGTNQAVGYAAGPDSTCY